MEYKDLNKKYQLRVEKELKEQEERDKWKVSEEQAKKFIKLVIETTKSF